MRFLSLTELRTLHFKIISTTGGTNGIRDLGALQSAIAQPRATLEGHDLYPDIVSKAATLGFGLIANHPFIDGNKRTGHPATAVFLILNNHEIRATLDEQEQIILEVASGSLDRTGFEHWLRSHVKFASS